MRIITRKSVYRLLALAVAVVLPGVIGYRIMLSMPGESYSGVAPALDARQQRIARQLRADVDRLVMTIGQRNLAHPTRLKQAAEYVTQRLADLGCRVTTQSYDVGEHRCHNLVVEAIGRDDPNQIVVIGAHYDSVHGSRGADDNASGVAVLLTLAEAFANAQPGRTLRFVAFVNEEPPHFQTDAMGSLVYARACAQRREKIFAMIALDGVGYFDDDPNSQHYPPPFNMFYPNTGNFIGFVSRVADRDLVRRCVGVFREYATLASEGGVGPQFIAGVGWSDHGSFWQCGYPAILVTDSLPFRNPHYHGASDLPRTLDYRRMTYLADGLTAVVSDLAACERPLP